MIALEQVFDWVWRVSASAAVIGLILLVLKRFLRQRLSPMWQYALWFILLGKLLLPISIATPFSLFNLLPTQAIAIQESAPVMIAEIDSQPLAGQILPQTVEKAPDNQTHLANKRLVAIIWLSGACGLMIFWSGQYGRMRYLLRRQGQCASEAMQTLLQQCQKEAKVRQPIQLIVQPLFDSPAIVGLRQKYLLLPIKGMGQVEETLRYIFLHELYHLRHKDLWINLLLLILQALHWFNPILWYCFARVRQDMELACDAAVVQHLTEAERVDYGRALLAVASQEQASWCRRSLAMANDYAGLRERIIQIKKAAFWQSKRRAIAILGSICLIAAGLLLWTNPITQEKNDLFGNNLASGDIQPELIKEQELWQSKTPYVGNPSAVGKIWALLPLREYTTKTALQTTEEPYSITFQIDLTTEPFLKDAIKQQLYRNAAMLIALVDNLDTVAYQISTQDTSQSWKGVITRSQADDAFGGELRQYTTSEEKFTAWFSSWEQTDITTQAQEAFWSESPAHDLLPPLGQARNTVTITGGKADDLQTYVDYISSQCADLWVIVYDGYNNTPKEWQYYTRDSQNQLLRWRYLPDKNNIFDGTYNQQSAEYIRELSAEEWLEQFNQ